MTLATATRPFLRSTTPAAHCLHLIRTHGPVARGTLISLTGLSQPTVTRAVTALVDAGLVREREDLAFTSGRGRPTIPVELADHEGLFAGIAVGTSTTRVAVHDTHGRVVRAVDVPTPVSRMNSQDILEHIIATLNKIRTEVPRPLLAVGATVSGKVSEAGFATAPNLGWNNVDVAGALEDSFRVPTTVAGAVPAILGAELQTTVPPAKGMDAETTAVLFADDSVGAALSTPEGVNQLPELPEINGHLLLTAGLRTEDALSTVGFLTLATGSGTGTARQTGLVHLSETHPRLRALLDERLELLGDVAATLIEEHNPATLIIAGSAFTSDPGAPRTFARRLRSLVGAGTTLRILPGHREIVSSVARAVALDAMSQDPLSFALQPA